MPTYEYRCKACDHRVEYFQSMSESPKRTCPRCRKRRLERQIGIGAAILFKGSGFYQTDYRSESYKQAASADKPASEAPKSEPSKAGTTEAKPSASGSGSGSAAGAQTKSDTKPSKKKSGS